MTKDFALNVTEVLISAGTIPDEIKLSRYNLKDRTQPDRLVVTPGLADMHRLRGRGQAIRTALSRAMPQRFQRTAPVTLLTPNSATTTTMTTAAAADDSEFWSSWSQHASSCQHLVVVLVAPVRLDLLSSTSSAILPMYARARIRVVNEDLLGAFPGCAIADLYSPMLAPQILGHMQDAFRPQPSVARVLVNIVLSVLWRKR